MNQRTSNSLVDQAMAQAEILRKVQYMPPSLEWVLALADEILKLREELRIQDEANDILTRQADELERMRNHLRQKSEQISRLQAGIEERQRGTSERSADEKIAGRPELRPDSPDIQYADVFKAMERGEPVDAQDSINALWWKVGNQRREIARLHAKQPLEKEARPKVYTHGLKLTAADVNEICGTAEETTTSPGFCPHCGLALAVCKLFVPSCADPL